MSTKWGTDHRMIFDYMGNSIFTFFNSPFGSALIVGIFLAVLSYWFKNSEKQNNELKKYAALVSAWAKYDNPKHLLSNNIITPKEALEYEAELNLKNFEYILTIKDNFLIKQTERVLRGEKSIDAVTLLLLTRKQINKSLISKITDLFLTKHDTLRNEDIHYWKGILQ